MPDDRDPKDSPKPAPSAPPVPAELADALAGFDLPEDEDPFGDLDPQEAMRNPMGALGKMFENPKAMEAFQSFMSTPMAREIMEQGFNSPILQQLMGGNPMLQSMMSQLGGQAASGGFPAGFPMPPGFAGGPAMDVGDDDEDDEDSDDDDEDGDDDEIDEPVLDLLSPPHGGPAFPSQRPLTWRAVMERVPASLQRPLTELAATKVAHHLGQQGVQRLQAEAAAAGCEHPLDLLINQGAFAGELAWYAICRLEDEDEEVAAEQAPAFAMLAKHALACVTLPCGWCVPSFVTQLLGYLLESEAASPEDVRHATWAIASQPVDGREGIFELDLEDLESLAKGLEAMTLEPQARAVALAALVAWRVLGEEQPQALPTVLNAVGSGTERQLMLTLGTLLDGQRELQGLRARGWPVGLALQVADAHAQYLGIAETLRLGQYWGFDGQAIAAHQGLLFALKRDWADAPADSRDRYLDHVLSCDVDPLRLNAYEVAVAWLPKPFLERAARDPAEQIRRWATAQAQALR